jgi:hypothetical protein
MARSEEELQIALCQYIKMQYPKVVFFSEHSGLRVGFGQAKKMKEMRSVGKLPDLFIAYPNGKFHGFFLELKVEGTTIFKRDGELVADPHIKAQFNTLVTLHKLGYAAMFGIGFDHAKKKVDGYLNMKPASPEIDFEQKKDKKNDNK